MKKYQTIIENIISSVLHIASNSHLCKNRVVQLVKRLVSQEGQHIICMYVLCNLAYDIVNGKKSQKVMTKRLIIYQ